jgi:hypothetical protein
MTKKPLEPIGEYETVLHGQRVTVKRYPAVKAPATVWSGFRWDNRRAPRTADNLWEITAEETAIEPDKNITDYAKLLEQDPIAEIIDWDKVGSDYNPETDREE